MLTLIALFACNNPSQQWDQVEPPDVSFGGTEDLEGYEACNCDCAWLCYDLETGACGLQNDRETLHCGDDRDYVASFQTDEALSSWHIHSGAEPVWTVLESSAGEVSQVQRHVTFIPESTSTTIVLAPEGGEAFALQLSFQGNQVTLEAFGPEGGGS